MTGQFMRCDGCGKDHPYSVSRNGKDGGLRELVRRALAEGWSMTGDGMEAIADKHWCAECTKRKADSLLQIA